MTKDKELLPCRCGGKPLLRPYRGNGWDLRCSKCGINFRGRVIRQTLEWLKDTLFDNWNLIMRPDQQEAPQHTGSCPLCDQRAKDGANMDGKHCARHKRPDFDCGAISCFDCMRIITEARKQAIPDTHALVPREPTDEMLDAGATYTESCSDSHASAGNAYRAMIEAAKREQP